MSTVYALPWWYRLGLFLYSFFENPREIDVYISMLCSRCVKVWLVTFSICLYSWYIFSTKSYWYDSLNLCKRFSRSSHNWKDVGLAGSSYSKLNYILSPKMCVCVCLSLHILDTVESDCIWVDTVELTFGCIQDGSKNITVLGTVEFNIRWTAQNCQFWHERLS